LLGGMFPNRLARESYGYDRVNQALVSTRLHALRSNPA
jgi:hypothetical protein